MAKVKFFLCLTIHCSKEEKGILLQQNWLNRADWLLLCLLEKREVSLQMRTECIKPPVLSRNRTEDLPWSQERFMQKPFLKNAPSPSPCQLQNLGQRSS